MNILFKIEALLISAFLLFTGCQRTSIERRMTENTLIMPVSSGPKSFNPVIAKETSTTSITRFVFEGLTETDGATLQVKPSLAEKWEVDETGTRWTFYLREDVKWHDGEDFTSDDVVFTYNRLIYNPDIPTSSRDVLNVDGKPFTVEKIDDYKVKFTLESAFAPFLRLMSQDILPMHKLSEAVEDGVFNSTWGVNTPLEDIVGTGPYRITGFVPGEWIILDRNELYRKMSGEGERLPHIDRLVLLVIADPNMSLLKFKRGDTDLNSVRGQDYSILKPFEESLNFTVYELGPSLGSEFIVFNQNKDAPLPPHKLEWYRNRDFRRAIAYAVDKDSIVENVYGGFAIPQSGPMNVSSGFFHNPDIKRREFDIKRAASLLEEQGFYTKNNRLFDSAGNPVEFSIMTNSDNFSRVQIGNILQDDLRKIGIRVHLMPVDFNTLVNHLSITKNWDMVIMGLTGGIEPHGGRNVWHTTGHLHIWNRGDDAHITEWEEEVDYIFDKGPTLLDETERKALYDRWQEIVAEEVPLIYTVSPSYMIAMRDRFGGLAPSVYGGLLHNIEEIYVLR